MKTESWIAVTDAGIQNLVNDPHLKKAWCSIVASLDSRSNITD
jgi:hypothetical protein